MKPEHSIHSKYSYPLANDSVAKHSGSVTDSELLSSIELLANTAQSLPQKVISEKDIMLEGASPTSLPQKKINEICKIALKRNTDCFNRERMLVRCIRPGQVRANKKLLVESGIINYLIDMDRNGYARGSAHSATLILPYASAATYASVESIGLIITDPENIYAAHHFDTNTHVNDDGSISCNHEAVGKSLADVAKKYKDREIDATSMNEIVLSKIALKEIGGLFVGQFNKNPFDNQVFTLAIINQRKIYDLTGHYLPIFIYNTTVPTGLVNNGYSELRLLTREEGINCVQAYFHHDFYEDESKDNIINIVNEIIESLQLPE